MVLIDTIQKYLPQELWDKAKDFNVIEDYIVKMPDLIVLIINSKSMDTNEEKQSWFNLLPLMNDEQIAKLRDILTREKQKLAEIEAKYEEKKEDIKNKYIQRWESMGYQNKIEEIKSQENQQQDQQEAEALLTQI